MTRGFIYLDHNATTPVSEPVKAAMLAAFDVIGNPSSIHRAGRAARAVVEDARDAVAAMVGANPANIVFTAGGTEANALAIKGIARAMKCTAAWCSGVEHPSVIANMTDLDSFLPVDANGVLDLNVLRDRLSAAKGPVLVSVMLANNETGVMQPITDIARLVHEYGAYLHCDTVQAPGRVAFHLNELGADAITLSAHKFGGPKGVGALVYRDGLTIAPIFEGGGQEKSRRSGTENVIGIAGFGAAAKDLPQMLSQAPRLAVMRDAMEARLTQSVAGTVVHGARAARLPNTSCVSVPGVPSQTQVIQLDLAGICVSTGSACSSGKVSLSHVLKAMGVADELTASAIRISLGATTTEADVNAFLEAYIPIVSAAS